MFPSLLRGDRPPTIQRHNRGKYLLVFILNSYPFCSSNSIRRFLAQRKGTTHAPSYKYKPLICLSLYFDANFSLLPDSGSRKVTPRATMAYNVEKDLRSDSYRFVPSSSWQLRFHPIRPEISSRYLRHGLNFYEPR